jgi:FkbM family methyltransferase
MNLSRLRNQISKKLYDRFLHKNDHLELVDKVSELGNDHLELVDKVSELGMLMQNLHSVSESLYMLVLRTNSLELKAKLKNEIIQKVSAQESLFAIDYRSNLYLTPYNDEIITPYINRVGYWEKSVSLFLEKILPDMKTFVNIGANFGYHAIQQAQNHPQLRVIAIEPHYKTFMLLKSNCELNNVQIELLELAISSVNGLVTLYQSEFNGGNNRLYPFKNSQYVGTAESLTIETCLQNVHVDHGVFLIDMQGHEIETVNSIFQLQQGKTICIFELDIDLNVNDENYYRVLIEKFPDNVSFSILDSMADLSVLTRNEFTEELLNSYNKDLIGIAQN